MLIFLVVVLLLRSAVGDLSAAEKARARMASLSKEKGDQRKVKKPELGSALPRQQQQQQQQQQAIKQEDVGVQGIPKEDAAKRSVSAYRRLEAANTTLLLDIITNKIRLKWFELSVDSISDRRQLGLLGEEVLDVIPEAVQIGRRPVRTKEDGIQYIEKFFHVDSHAVFMHALGANQELAKRQAEINLDVVRIQKSLDDQEGMLNASIEEIQVSLQAAADEGFALEEKRNDLRETKVKILETERQIEVDINAFIADLQHKAIANEDLLQEKALMSEDASSRALEHQAIQLEDFGRQAEQDALRQQKDRIQKQAVQNQFVIDKLRNEALLATATARYQAKAQAERQNEDIHLRAMRTRAAQERKRILEALAAGLTAVGNGFLHVFNDRELLCKLIAAALLIMAGAFFSREFAALARDLAEAYFGQPRLVRETSRKKIFSISALFPTKKLKSPTSFLKDVVLTDTIKNRLLQLAASTRNAKRNGAPFRHILLYGPPGTGKTLTAKKLAKASGLDYALISGGDVGPLGAQGVTALHALFRWAYRSKRGLLIFIDEAEAFLASREKARLTEHMRNALNAFLYHTGTPNSAFVIVLATNRPNDLDEAVLDRIDDAVEVPLPATDSHRLQLAQMYFNKYLRSPPPATKLSFFSKRAHSSISITDDAVTQLPKVARLTEGFSAREIEKLMVAIQSAAYGSPHQCLDAATIITVLNRKRYEHSRKVHLAKIRGNHVRQQAVDKTKLSLDESEKKLKQKLCLDYRQSSDPVDASDIPEDVPEVVHNATIVRASTPLRAPAVHATIISEDSPLHVTNAIVVDE